MIADHVARFRGCEFARGPGPAVYVPGYGFVALNDDPGTVDLTPVKSTPALSGAFHGVGIDDFRLSNDHKPAHSARRIPNLIW